MKFAEIIREAGFTPCCFPKASQISVTLYDRNERVVKEETIHYFQPLFVDNPQSQKNFFVFLHALEEQEHVQEMNAKIDQYVVILFYKSPDAKIFLRYS